MTLVYAWPSMSEIGESYLGNVQEVNQKVSFQWPNNPGQQTPPEERNQYLTVDQARAVRGILQRLVLTEILKNAKCVMDVGCVTGMSTFELALRALKNCIIVGVDTLENTHFATGEYCPRSAGQNLSYEAAVSILDLPRAPDGNEGWGIITAFAFFSWVPIDEQPLVLKHIYSLLAPKGTFLARTEGVSDRPYRQATDAVMKLDKWSPYFVDYSSAYQDQTAEQFAEFLKSAGFVDVKTHFSQDEFYFPTKDAMILYFLQWLPQLSALPKEKHKEFVTEVIDEYCFIMHNTGSEIPLNFPCIEVTATKGDNYIPFGAVKG